MDHMVALFLVFIILGYDGYYITEEENIFYLKRNQKVVAKLEKNNAFVVYKDTIDKDSKYIAVEYLCFLPMFSTFYLRFLLTVF